MEFKLTRLSDYSNDALIAELRRVSELIPLGHLTGARFNQHSRASASVMWRRFGGWKQALEAAGIGVRYGGKPVTDRMRSQPGKRVTPEQVTEQLRKVAKKLGREDLTVEDFNSHAEFSVAPVRSIYKTWSKALAAAGLTVRATSVRYSDEECFENLLKVWTHHRRQPMYREMNLPPSDVGAKAYLVRWGSWTQALEMFVERVAQDEPASVTATQSRPVTKNSSRTAEEDDGRVRLGIRYRILVRDNFKCALCGNSPATDPTCRLHVDHFRPYSKGGLTVVENLRALCGQCNVGKGNLTIEASR